MSNTDNEKKETTVENVHVGSGIDWKRKLTSRKFWTAVCSFVVLILVACGKSEVEAKQVAAIVMAGAVVIGYILGEGLTDYASISNLEYEEYEVEDEE